MKRIRAVSFDAVGTLITPHPGVGAVYAEVASDWQIMVTADEIDARFPAAFAEVRAAWGVPFGADEEDARAFWTAVISEVFAQSVPTAMAEALFDAFAAAHRWRLLPGAAQAWELVRARGLPVAIVSNFDGRLPRILDQLALAPVDAWVLSSREGIAKPDPVLMQRAARALGCAPRDMVHVGDSQSEDGAMCTTSGAIWLPADDGIDVAALELHLEAA